MATSVGIKMQMDGAAQFQADLKQITQKSKELAAEMKAAAAGEDNLADKQRILAAQMDNARAKIDKLNEKYKAQEKALQETKQQLEQAKKAYGDDSEEARKLTLEVTKQETALSKTKTEINKATAELNQMERQTEDTTQETHELTDAQEKAGQASGKISEGFTVLKGALANLAADGIRKAIDGFKEIMTAGPAFADEILTMSSQTSIAADRLQELAYMSDLVDVDVSTVAGSMKKLTKNMSSARGGTGAAADAFKTLGVSVTDVNGNLRDNEEVFFDSIDALGKIQNETERDSVAMTLFGKSATDLNPMIEAGADALKGYAKEAHDMGYVLDNNSLKALGRVQDEFDRFNRQMESVKNQIAAGIAPAVERGMKRVQQIIASIDWKKIGQQIGKAFEKLIDVLEWVLDHGAEIKAILTGIVTAMAAQKIAAFVSAIAAMVPALKAATIAQEGMNVAANANPYILLATVLIGLTAAFISWGKSLSDAYWAETELGKETAMLDAMLEQNAETTRNITEAYAEMESARTSSITSTQAEAEHLSSLTAELGTLVDANGNVADSDRARAEFILGQLNSALGTEYTMNDLINGQYATMEQSVYSLIEAKRVEAILSAQEDAYAQAVLGRADAEAALAQTVSSYTDVVNNRAAAEAELEALQEDNFWKMDARTQGEIDRLEEKIAKYDETAAQLESDYAAQAETVDKYVFDMTQYENNWAAAHDHAYDKIDTRSWETAKAMGDAGSAYSSAAANSAYQAKNSWMTELGQMLSQTTGMNWEFQAAGNGMVQAYVNGEKQGEAAPANQVRAMGQQMHQEMVQTQSTMQTDGQYAAIGVGNGIYSGSGYAHGAMSSFASGLVGTFKSLFKISSPSKVMAEMGKFMVEGLAQGIKKNQDTAIGAVETFGDDIQSAFNPNLGTISTGLGTYMMPSGSASVVTDNRSNSYVINVYGAEGQNVNELADAVAERIQMNIERDEAVYA